MNERELNTIQGLTTRYEALGLQTISQSMTTGPDETMAIGELWQGEIERTRQAFRLTNWTLRHCLKIRVSMLLQHDEQGNTIRDDGRPGPKFSDNRLTRLIYQNEAQTLVSMMETRNDNNAQVIQIARFPLLPGTVMSLEGMVEADNDYRQGNPGAS